jgi:hypothetical protein
LRGEPFGFIPLEEPDDILVVGMSIDVL